MANLLSRVLQGCFPPAKEQCGVTSFALSLVHPHLNSTGSAQSPQFAEQLIPVHRANIGSVWPAVYLASLADSHLAWGRRGAYL